jgi:hypothetical protein
MALQRLLKHLCGLTLALRQLLELLRILRFLLQHHLIIAARLLRLLDHLLYDGAALLNLRLNVLQHNGGCLLGVMVSLRGSEPTFIMPTRTIYNRRGEA